MNGHESTSEEWRDVSRAVDVKKQRRKQRAQGYWLAVCLFFNVFAIGVDKIALGDAFEAALILRLLFVMPLMATALALHLRSSNLRLRSLATSIATIAFIASVSALGQFGNDVFASRYMMIAIFMLFSAITFAGLPWRETKLVYLASLILYAVIVVTGCRWAIVYTNIDLIFLCATTCSLALVIRKRQDRQMSEIFDMRRIAAERTIELEAANRRLEMLSTVDPLTGVFNRRYLDELMDGFATSLVPSTGYGVLMIDVDHFKSFNDRSGHPAGDRCLRKVAAAIENGLRSSADTVVRYGGEEFVVILPAAGRAETLAVAERLRMAVADLQIEHRGLGPDRVVTISIGASCAVNEPMDAAVSLADAALYEAKQAGRNRVFAAPQMREQAIG